MQSFIRKLLWLTERRRKSFWLICYFANYPVAALAVRS